MTTIYDLYECNPWRKVAEISEEEMAWPDMASIQAEIGRFIVPKYSQERPKCPQDRFSPSGA